MPTPSRREQALEAYAVLARGSDRIWVEPREPATNVIAGIQLVDLGQVPKFVETLFGPGRDITIRTIGATAFVLTVAINSHETHTLHSNDWLIQVGGDMPMHVCADEYGRYWRQVGSDD